MAAMTEAGPMLLALVAAQAPEHAAWLERATPKPGDEIRSTALRAAIAGCGRRLRDRELGGEPRQVLQPFGVVTDRWSLADLARSGLLLRALELLPADRHVELVREIFRRGDYHEQAAVLKSLILLPAPERFVDLAVEACRTNVLDVFEAIACENPYPARFFPALNFNQLVLKALFMGVAVARIHGLAERRTDELRRMAADYASERRAAGRSVPADIDLVLAEEGKQP